MAHRYAHYVEGLDPVTSLEETSSRIAALVRGREAQLQDRTYAPGKWTARQLLAHLAQAEIVFANRLRFGATTGVYVVQPFDQDDWMNVDVDAAPAASLEAYLALRALNVALCRSLTPAQRSRTFVHPEAGTIDLHWLITYFAGHDRHHLPHFEAIAAGA